MHDDGRGLIPVSAIPGAAIPVSAVTIAAVPEGTVAIPIAIPVWGVPIVGGVAIGAKSHINLAPGGISRVGGILLNRDRARLNS